jgi:hypothetical protein
MYQDLLGHLETQIERSKWPILSARVLKTNDMGGIFLLSVGEVHELATVLGI